MGVGYCKPNCIHFDDWSCNKKPKVFFGLFKASCESWKWQTCPLMEPYPRPKATPYPHPHMKTKPNICDVCGRIMEKDW